MARKYLPLNRQWLKQVKKAYTTRRAPLAEMSTLMCTHMTPRAGDLALCRVGEIGHHKRLELTDGRKARLFPGDDVLVVFGNRYAPDQFEALVPDDLEPCHLVAAGGIAARVVSRHQRVNNATQLFPLGIVGDRRPRPLNLSQFGLPAIRVQRPRPRTLAVFGTSMNSGKTTVAASLIKGLVRAGFRVGAAKVTGTGAGGDLWFFQDAGADPVFDFIDAGFVSTYRLTAGEVQEIFMRLMDHLTETGVDAIVIEIADGLFQRETAELACLHHLHAVSCLSGLQTQIDGTIFAARDALGAVAGVQTLRASGLAVMALSGQLARSPLAAREAREATGLAVLDPAAIQNGFAAALAGDSRHGLYNIEPVMAAGVT